MIYFNPWLNISRGSQLTPFSLRFKDTFVIFYITKIVFAANLVFFEVWRHLKVRAYAIKIVFVANSVSLRFWRHFPLSFEQTGCQPAWHGRFSFWIIYWAWRSVSGQYWHETSTGCAGICGEIAWYYTEKCQRQTNDRKADVLNVLSSELVWSPTTHHDSGLSQVSYACC